MSRLCRDEFDEAVVVAGQLRDQARRSRDDGLLVESTYLLGIGAFWGGHLDAARDHFVEVVTRFQPEQRPHHLLRFGQDPQIVCLSRLGNTLRFLGDLDAARRASDDAVTMADGVGHPFSRGVALIFAALLAIDLDETDRVGELVDALRRDPHPARPNDIKTDALGGYAEIVAGNAATGLEQLRRAIETSGLVNHAPGFVAALLRVLVAGELLAGDAEGGLAAADQALRLGGTRLWEADIRMARAGSWRPRANRPPAWTPSSTERRPWPARRGPPARSGWSRTGGGNGRRPTDRRAERSPQRIGNAPWRRVAPSERRSPEHATHRPDGPRGCSPFGSGQSPSTDSLSTGGGCVTSPPARSPRSATGPT